MVDFFADVTIKEIINEIINNKNKINNDKNNWFQLTKLMLKNYSISEVLQLIEQAIEEESDEQWFENKYPEIIFNETFVIPKQEKVTYKTDNRLRDLINTKLKITDVAKDYSLDTDCKGRTTCPFHEDSDPSLILNNKRNVFHCFGCGEKGDIITFIKKMENLKGVKKNGDGDTK